MAYYCKIFTQWDKKWWKDTDFPPSSPEGISWYYMLDGDGEEN